MVTARLGLTRTEPRPPPAAAGPRRIIELEIILAIGLAGWLPATVSRPAFRTTFQSPSSAVARKGGPGAASAAGLGWESGAPTVPLQLVAEMQMKMIFFLAIIVLLRCNNESVSALRIFDVIDEYISPPVSSVRPSTTKSQHLKAKPGTINSTLNDPMLIHGTSDAWLYLVLPITVPIYIILWSAPVWMWREFLPWLESTLVGTWAEPGLLLSASIAIKNRITEVSRSAGKAVARLRHEMIVLLYPGVRWLLAVFVHSIRKLQETMAAAISSAFRAAGWLNKEINMVACAIQEKVLQPLIRQSLKATRLFWKQVILPAAATSRYALRVLGRWIILIAQRLSRNVLRPAARAAISGAYWIHRNVLFRAAHASCRVLRTILAALHSAIAAVRRDLLPSLIETTSAAARWIERNVLHPVATGTRRVVRATTKAASATVRAGVSLCRAAYRSTVVPAARTAARLAAVVDAAARDAHSRVLLPVARGLGHAADLAWTRAVRPAAAHALALARVAHHAVAVPAGAATVQAVAWLWDLFFGPSSGWLERSLAAAYAMGARVASAVGAVLGPPARAVARAAVWLWRAARAVLLRAGRLVSAAAGEILRRYIMPAIRAAARLLRRLLAAAALAVRRIASAAAAAAVDAARAVHHAAVIPAARAFAASARAARATYARSAEAVRAAVAAARASAGRLGAAARDVAAEVRGRAAAAAVKAGGIVRRIQRAIAQVLPRLPL